MRKIPFNEISFLQIQIFLVAAEELNYTRTAERLYVTQPTVSRSIDSLEKLTGLQLFLKEPPKKMRLTPAGKMLHQYLSKAMDTMTNGFHHAWELQEGYRYILNISYPYGTNPGIIFRIVNIFKNENPSVRVHFRISRGLNQELQDLLSYETDFCITHSHDLSLLEPYDELKCRELIRLPLAVIMTKENPLSKKESLTYRDLASSKIIFPRNNTHPAYEVMLLQSFALHNIVPHISYQVSSSEEGILNLHEKDEVIILNQLADIYNREDCAVIPLLESSSGLIMVNRTADEKKMLHGKFISTVQNYIESM